MITLMMEPDHRAALFFLSLPGFGRRKAGRLFSTWKQSGFKAQKNDLQAFLENLPLQLSLSETIWSTWDLLLSDIMKSGCRVVLSPKWRWCAEMPEKDRPFLLFVKGSTALLADEGEAVIGCRHPTKGGFQAAFKEGARIAESGRVVVSGLALGCDTAGHKGALDAGGRTVAYMPCGMSSVYPPENKLLARTILEQGGSLISEYLPEQSPQNWCFIERDRLQAAQSTRLFVAECGLEGGTWHTIGFARKYGKKIDVSRHFAISSPASCQLGNKKLLENSWYQP